MREPVGQPLVSIIVPTRDRPELLEEALQSIARQTFSDWEAIVVDDGSFPAVDAPRLHRRFGARVRVLQHARSRGGAAAKNTGIDAAKGRLLAFLDDDDLLAPDYVARAVEVLQANRDLAGTFMSVRRFGALRDDDLHSDRAMQGVLARAQGTCRHPDVLEFGSALFAALLHSVPMAFQRVVVRREAFEAIGRYEAHCLLWDCDWAVRAAATQRFARSPEINPRLTAKRQLLRSASLAVASRAMTFDLPISTSANQPCSSSQNNFSNDAVA